MLLYLPFSPHSNQIVFQFSTWSQYWIMILQKNRFCRELKTDSGFCEPQCGHLIRFVLSSLSHCLLYGHNIAFFLLGFHFYGSGIFIAPMGFCQWYWRSLVPFCIDYCNFNVFTFPKWRWCLGWTAAGVSGVILLSRSVWGCPGGLFMTHTLGLYYFWFDSSCGSLSHPLFPVYIHIVTI